MKIAILGGTGDIGQGLALRLAADTITRSPSARATQSGRRPAEEYTTELDSRGLDATVAGAENETAAAAARVIVLAVPPYHVGDTVEAIADTLDEGDVLVSPATGMKRDDEGFHYHRPGAGSVTRIAADAAPDGVDVVGAFHNLAAARSPREPRRRPRDRHARDR